MANIRKSFSFRNGVQVDENNFVVNANGLVGIGTSVPSEILDVRGTTKVVGLVTASDVFVSGVATITEIQVGTAITIASGVISATSFKGDDTGVIAQEIESLGLPGVTETRDDGTKAVRYEKLVPVLIQAIKELSAKVDALS